MYNNAYYHRYLILLQTHKVKSCMIPLYIMLVDNGGSNELSYQRDDLIQGIYQFRVVAFTRTGSGDAASLILSTLFNEGKFII